MQIGTKPCGSHYNGPINLDTDFQKMRENATMKIYDKTIKDFQSARKSHGSSGRYQER